MGGRCLRLAGRTGRTQPRTRRRYRSSVLPRSERSGDSDPSERSWCALLATVMVRLKPSGQRCSDVSQRRLGSTALHFPPGALRPGGPRYIRPDILLSSRKLRPRFVQTTVGVRTLVCRPIDVAARETPAIHRREYGQPRTKKDEPRTESSHNPDRRQSVQVTCNAVPDAETANGGGLGETCPTSAAGDGGLGRRLHPAAATGTTTARGWWR